jgi:hypothetical protein
MFLFSSLIFFAKLYPELFKFELIPELLLNNPDPKVGIEFMVKLEFELEFDPKPEKLPNEFPVTDEDNDPKLGNTLSGIVFDSNPEVGVPYIEILFPEFKFPNSD